MRIGVNAYTLSRASRICGKSEKNIIANVAVPSPHYLLAEGVWENVVPHDVSSLVKTSSNKTKTMAIRLNERNHNTSDRSKKYTQKRNMTRKVLLRKIRVTSRKKMYHLRKMLRKTYDTRLMLVLIERNRALHIKNRNKWEFCVGSTQKYKSPAQIVPRQKMMSWNIKRRERCIKKW